MSTLTPEVKKAVKGYCDEMSASMSRSEGERDLQKEATKDLAEKHELDKKMLKKMASAYHKSNFNTVKTDNAEFESMYEELFGATV